MQLKHPASLRTFAFFAADAPAPAGVPLLSAPAALAPPAARVSHGLGPGGADAGMIDAPHEMDDHSLLREMLKGVLPGMEGEVL